MENKWKQFSGSTSLETVEVSTILLKIRLIKSEPNMKIIFTQHFFGKLVITCILFITTATFSACTIVESIPSSTKSIKREPVSEKTLIQGDNVVKIYPDAFKRILHVKSLVETPLDFYVFDLEGSLELHYKMIGKEHKKITSLKRGYYTYQVFEGDAMTDSGKINIK